MDTPLDERLVIIESETGSGKTEAALWRFALMYQAKLVDGLYFALPTRAAAVQIHERVGRFTTNLFPEGPPALSWPCRATCSRTTARGCNHTWSGGTSITAMRRPGLRRIPRGIWPPR